MVNFGATLLPAAMVVVFNVITGVAAGPDPDNWRKTFPTPYSGDPKWNDKWKDEARYHAARACNGFDGQRGFYQDIYYQPWKKSPHTLDLCVNTGNNKVNFRIGNLNPDAGFQLARQDCASGLSDVINRFDRGGERQAGGWYFSADPNWGHC